MELPTSLDQPLQGQIVCACLDMFLPVCPLFVPRDSVASNLQKPAALQQFLLAASMKCTTCTKHDTGSAVARVTKDRAARPHLPSTVKNQLGRRRQRRQLLTIGQWNVRTLLDREGANRPERRTALVAMELAKYNIDIAALCETRFSESGSLNDLEYSFFWSGKPEGERREAGVGFAIKKDIVTKLTEMPWPVSDRIMTMRLPLSKDNFDTIISVYAPTMTNPDENKEAFYNQLASVLSGIPRTDKLLLRGDFNARIGRDNDKWPLVMGKHGIGKCNSNGELLLALCSEFELIVTNTMFKQKFQTLAYDRLHYHEVSG